MENHPITIQKIDLFFLFRIWLRYARCFWALALILVILGSVILGYGTYLVYTPEYEASVSFTVKLSNPLYGSDNANNVAAARQLHETFPYVLRSEILRQRVCEHLGADEIPEISTSVLENSNIFTMRVRDPDPEWAHLVLEAVIKCYPQIADYVVGETELILLDESGVPTSPVYAPDLGTFLILGATGGILLWALFLLLLTLGRKTVHNEGELRQMLSLDCLGILPATRVVGRDTLCPLINRDSGKHGFADSVRLVQLHVHREIKGQNRKILMVCGALPGEGKTTVAVNLAISFAKNGYRTLIADCDLYNCTVAGSLSVENRTSMKDYLQGLLQSTELICPTSVDHLYTMTMDVDIQDEKNKAAVKSLLDGLRETYDIIIMDTPPCSLAVDTAELADLADCALMVIRQDYATRAQILEGVRMLTDNGLPMVGCVMNAVSGNLETNGYRFGNGYGYGSGSK